MGTASVNTVDKRLEIQSIPLSGTIGDTTPLDIVVTNFKNPTSGCSVLFRCRDSASSGSFEIPFKVLGGTLAGRATLWTRIGISVVPDPNSAVGDYFPLTIEITPTVKFPSGGYILVSLMTLQNTASDCATAITNKAKLDSIECTYANGEVKIKAVSLAGGVVELTNTDKIAFTLNKVLYNSKKTAKSVSVILADSSSCNIEAGEKAGQWVPAKPAAFTALTFNYESTSKTSVCGPASFSVQLRPSFPVRTSQHVTIEFKGAVTLSTTTKCAQLSEIEINGQTLKGHPSSEWGTTDSTTLVIADLTLPTTEEPFKIVISTYDGLTVSPTELVHQQESPTLAAKRGTPSGFSV